MLQHQQCSSISFPKRFNFCVAMEVNKIENELFIGRQFQSYAEVDELLKKLREVYSIAVHIEANRTISAYNNKVF